MKKCETKFGHSEENQRLDVSVFAAIKQCLSRIIAMDQTWGSN